MFLNKLPQFIQGIDIVGIPCEDFSEFFLFVTEFREFE